MGDGAGVYRPAPMTGLVIAACSAAGVVVGAFVNHAVTRWLGWRLVVPELLGWAPAYAAGRGARAACGSCGRSWAVGGLPVAPYLLTAGRCRGCRLPLARRGLFIEVTTAVLFGLAAARIDRWAALVPVLVLFACLVAVSVVDLEAQRIPTRFVYGTFVVCAPLVGLASAQLDVPRATFGAAVGAAGYFGFLLVFHLVSPRRMGFGDVRLALLLGLFLGWFGWDPDFPVLSPLALVVWGALLGSLIGSVIGITVIVASRRNRYFPFGPGLAAGTIAVLLAVGAPG